MTKNNDNKIVILVVPYLGHSHLNMALNLSHIISSSYAIPVHYVTSTQHLNLLKSRNLGDDDCSEIVFHDYLVPSWDDLVDTPKSLPHLYQPVFDLIRELSSSYDKLVVVHDSLMASVVESVKDVNNAECYAFHTSSLFSIFVGVWRAIPDKPFELDPPDVLPSFLPAASEALLPSEYATFVVNQYKLSFVIDVGTLYNGNKAIEGTYLRLLKKLYPMKKHFAVGPVINKNASSGRVINVAKSRWMKWLDEQENDSVIYISFGTTVAFPQKQIDEMAIGFERSGHKFMWALRQADRGDISKNQQEEVKTTSYVLPEGFLERIGNKGIVISDEWVPQVEILGHPSVGGFVTHCGWGSLTESLTMGVPVIACPIHSDQPLNSVLVTEVLKVGFLIREDFWEMRLQLIEAEIIEKAVRRLMGSEEGEGMRRRAEDVGIALAGSMGHGSDMDSFIAHITRP